MTMVSKTDKDDELPLSADDVRRLVDQKPTAEVPREYRQYFEAKPQPRKKVQRIEWATEKEIPEIPHVLDSFRPDWVGLSRRPVRAPRTREPIVTRRGEKLRPYHIFQPDDRKTYNDLTYPWGCICHITDAGGYMGSGVLVGPRHVLTASHVVDWTTDVSEKIQVHLTGRDAAAVAYDTIVYANTQIENTSWTTIDEDYAVLVLDQRLGDIYGWLGVRTYDSSWDGDAVWYNIGYPGDVAGGVYPTYQRNTSLDEDAWDFGSGRSMTTTADADHGQSGGPMFAFWSKGPYAVAVVSSGDDRNQNWCSGGSALTRLVRRARDENP